MRYICVQPVPTQYDSLDEKRICSACRTMRTTCTNVNFGTLRDTHEYFSGWDERLIEGYQVLVTVRSFKALAHAPYPNHDGSAVPVFVPLDSIRQREVQELSNSMMTSDAVTDRGRGTHERSSKAAASSRPGSNTGNGDAAVLADDFCSLPDEVFLLQATSY